MAIEVTFPNQTTPQEARASNAFDKLAGVVEKFKAALDAHHGALAKIGNDVKAELLTGKVADQKRLEASDALGRQLEGLADELAISDAELEAALNEFENPVTQEERDEADLAGIAEKGIKTVLKKMRDDQKFSSYGIDSLNAGDYQVAALHFLTKELGAVAQTLRRSEIRQSLLNTQGATISEKDPHSNAFSARKLTAHEFRVHVYEKAVEAGDWDIVAVCEDPLNEAAFFNDGQEGGWKSWSKYMQAKGKAQIARLDKTKENAKTKAQGLRNRATQARFHIGHQIAELINTGALVPSGVQMQKLERLLGTHSVSGYNFGTGFNPFRAAKHAKNRGR